MKTNERITHEPGNPEAWVCICNNTPCGDGFYPCDDKGEEMEPIKGWKELYVCGKCGRIIHQDTLEVVGTRAGASQMPPGNEVAQSFPVLGSLYSTPRAQKAIEESGETFYSFLTRYLRGDWGDCSEDVWKVNDHAAIHDGRILAVYHTKRGEELWVITESDRSGTTFLLPDEY